MNFFFFFQGDHVMKHANIQIKNQKKIKILKKYKNTKKN